MAKPDKQQNALAIPDEILAKLSAADERKGFPPGTMQSLMQQEIGGQFDKFFKDPTTYHYPAGAGGKRKAPNGKTSSAFGPFGILDSTAVQPGYGTAPLKDKSFESQLEFAADYLSNRSKKGGLAEGLAGYGEGRKYAAQVLGRVGINVPTNTLPNRKPTGPIQVANVALPPAKPNNPNNIQVASNTTNTPLPIPLPSSRRNNSEGQQGGNLSQIPNTTVNPLAFDANRLPVPDMFAALRQINEENVQDPQMAAIQAFQGTGRNGADIFNNAAFRRLQQIAGTEVNL